MLHSTQIHSQRSIKEQQYLDGWQRAVAQLDNFRQRLNSQRVQEAARLKKELLVSLMSIADNFQAMIDHVPDSLRENSWTKGVLHISRQLEQVLQGYGLTPIKALHRPFDPRFHEAIGQVKGKKSGHITEVTQTGYLLDDQVLRPAKVKVAK